MHRVAGFVAMVMVAFVGACEVPGEGQSESIERNFEIGQWDPLLTRHSKTRIHVDMDGPNLPASDADRDTLKDNVRTAINRWLAPTRVFGTNPDTAVWVTICSDPRESSNDFCEVVDSYYDPDLRKVIKERVPRKPTVRLTVAPQSMGRSVYDTQNAVVRLDPSAGFRVILHEFGHAFGLGDTYEEGGTFPCHMELGMFAPSSTSVMCNANFDSPQTDDIAGIQHLFCKTFPGDCNDRP